jgi:hypothetical protein
MLSGFGSGSMLATHRISRRDSSAKRKNEPPPNERFRRWERRGVYLNNPADLLARGRPVKKLTFFIASIAGIFAESPEMRFERGPVPTSLRAAPFKKF